MAFSLRCRRGERGAERLVSAIYPEGLSFLQGIDGLAPHLSRKAGVVLVPTHLRTELKPSVIASVRSAEVIGDDIE
jgi:hypothetical protein